MAVVFPTGQVPTVEGPALDIEYRWGWTGAIGGSLDRVRQSRIVESITVTWLCTKEATDLPDVSVAKWTEAPIGYERSQAALRIVNPRTRPQLCSYEEVWRREAEEWS